MSRVLIFLLMISLSPLSLSQQAGQGLTKLSEISLAPDFVLTDVDGNQHQLSDYRGQVLIINFWATWCPPCRAEMPSMQRAWEQLEKEGILMLGINVGEDEDTIFLFSADYPVEFPLLMDSDSRVINQWPVRGLPTTFVVDIQGKIVYRAIGGREWDDPELLGFVRALK
ncbi:MAG: redoxin domain-containing protein [Gammaproteobacteria bacterium]|nr:redoxin domain-containing protein [Gammaproteobacteria bacterium]